MAFQFSISRYDLYRMRGEAMPDCWQNRTDTNSVPVPLFTIGRKSADGLESTMNSGVIDNYTVYSPRTIAFTILTLTVLTVPGTRSCHPLTTPCSRSLSVMGGGAGCMRQVSEMGQRVPYVCSGVNFLTTFTDPTVECG